MHETAFIHVNDITVAAVAYEMAPPHSMYLARQREVVIPSIALGGVQFVYVAAAAASASVDEGVVTDGFLTEFSEAMTACLMLDRKSVV